MVNRKGVLLGSLVLVVTMLLPGFVLSAFGLTEAAGIAALVGVCVLLASLLADRRVAVLLVPPLAVAGWLACLVSDRPWLAALVMACCAGAAGLTARWGMASAVSMAPITVGFVLADPPALRADNPALTTGVIMLATGLLTAAAGWLMARHLPSPSLQSASAPRAEAYAALLALLTGVAAWIVVTFHWSHAGAWLIMTILVVVQPYLQDSWTRTLNRLAGTVLGFVLAIACMPLGQWPPFAYVVGAVAMFLALAAKVQHRAYWIYATFLTLAIVMLEGTGTSIEDTARERLVATLVGAAMALIATAILAPIYRRSATQRGLDRW